MVKCCMERWQGLAMSIPPEDYIWQKLAELKDIGLQWADHAKKVDNTLPVVFKSCYCSIIWCFLFCGQVATDSGALGLDKVFELISEGENLPIYLEKELKVTNSDSV